MISYNANKETTCYYYTLLFIYIYTLYYISEFDAANAEQMTEAIIKIIDMTKFTLAHHASYSFRLEEQQQAPTIHNGGQKLI
jgi:hypothetical protein